MQMSDGMQFPRNESPNNVALWPIAFASKRLTNTETCYSYIEREVLGILHGLEKIHHYCFTHEESVITDHKLLVAILKKMLQAYHTGLREYY